MIICHTAFSQSNTNAAVNTGGGSSKLFPDFTIDWNIGECTVIDTYAGVNLSSNPALTSFLYFTGGVLQPFDNTRLFNYSNIFNTPVWAVDDVNLFPVPTKDLTTLYFKSYPAGKISVMLYDKSGTFLQKKIIPNGSINNKQVWDLSIYKTGLYFFHILLQSIDETIILKSGVFQVIKL